MFNFWDVLNIVDLELNLEMPHVKIVYRHFFPSGILEDHIKFNDDIFSVQGGFLNFGTWKE